MCGKQQLPDHVRERAAELVLAAEDDATERQALKIAVASLLAREAFAFHVPIASILHVFGQMARHHHEALISLRTS